MENRPNEVMRTKRIVFLVLLSFRYASIFLEKSSYMALVISGLEETNLLSWIKSTPSFLLIRISIWAPGSECVDFQE